MKAVYLFLVEALFGKYLGIQVFIAPITMFYLIRSDSIMKAGTSLLGFRIHYLPLLVFLIMLVFMLFMMVKLRLLQGGTYQDYIDSVIELNISMLGLIIIALITYAVSSFLAYFYGIKGTVKDSMYLLFKLYTSLLILYHYLLNHLLTAFCPTQLGRRRAIRYIKAWGLKHKYMMLRYLVFLSLVVMAMARLYILLIHYALAPILTGLKEYTGINLRFSLVQFYGLQDVFFNVAVLFVAFMISNLMIYPLVYGGEYLINKYLPFKAITGIDNAQATQ